MTSRTATCRCQAAEARPGLRAFARKSFSAPRPPSSANDPPPRCRLSRPEARKAPAFSSHSGPGARRPCRTSARLKAFSASVRVRPAASSTASRASPPGSSPGSVATPRAMESRSSRPGNSCSITANWHSSSTGICSTGDRTTTNVRSALPAAIRVSRAWATSAEPSRRWKWRSTRTAVPPGEAMASRTSGSPPAVWAGVGPPPGSTRPRSRSQAARGQPRSRQRAATSAGASSGSWVRTHSAGKQARTCSSSRSVSVIG